MCLLLAIVIVLLLLYLRFPPAEGATAVPTNVDPAAATFSELQNTIQVTMTTAREVAKTAKLMGGEIANRISASVAKGLNLAGDNQRTHSKTYVPAIEEVVANYPPRLEYGNSYKYGPFHDLDPEYVIARERLGACFNRTTLHPPKKYIEDISNLGTNNDDIPDGERSVRRSGHCVRAPATLQLLYRNTMNLPIDQQPSPDDCEYLAYNGYVFKEQCY